MIEIITSDNFTDELWKQYFKLYQEIYEKYYPDRFNKGYSLKDLKTDTEIKIINDPGYENYIVLNDGNPIAWFYFTAWGDVLYFSYFVLDEFVNEELLKDILRAAYKKMHALNYFEIYNTSYRKANIDVMLRIDAMITEEYISSRLEREYMNKSFYDSIITEFVHSDWKIGQYNNIPQVYIEQYLECFNLAFEDMLKLTSIKVKYPLLTREQIIGNSENEKKAGKELKILLLFDNDNTVAGLCGVYLNRDNREIISHENGFTAVHPKYRGIGIGRYLKAKLYDNLLAENIEFTQIITNTMKSNIYMNRINDEFGFKAYRKGFCFKLTKEFIKNYLNL